MANPALGIGVMLVSTSLMNIGIIIQKKAVDALPDMDGQSVGDNLKGVVTSKLWWGGWITITIGMVFNMIALGQADMSLIQPLISVGLVVGVVFSHYYLKESISKLEIAGIAVAISGVIVLGILASPSQEFATPDEIMSKLVQFTALLIITIFIACVAILWIVARKTEKLTAGIIFAVISAIFSVLGFVFSKALFSVIDVVGFVPTLGIGAAWLILLIFLTFSTLSIAVQQMSLQRGKGVVVTPVFNLCSIILPLVTGAMVFGEIINEGKIIAMVVIIIGAILLSYKKEAEILENT